ncbi:MAG: hypothetical protein QW821_01385 [Candidatus Bathyarchaeia archaeon]
MSTLMKTYTISLHGFWKYQADVFDENYALVARSELKRREVSVDFLNNRRRVLMRHGFLRQEYKLIDENGDVISYSHPKMTKYPLTFYIECDKEWLRIERSGFFHISYIFYNALQPIAWIKKKGMFSRTYELKICESSMPLIIDIISIAVGVVVFDAVDSAAASAASAGSVSAAATAGAVSASAASSSR